MPDTPVDNEPLLGGREKLSSTPVALTTDMSDAA